MAIVKPRFRRGIIIRPDDIGVDSIEGELKVGLTSQKLHAYLGGALRSIVTENQTQVLTNKTLDADSNTLSNIEVDNLKTGVLNTDVALTGASNTQVPSALAVKTYIDSGLAGQNQASEITVAAIPGLAGANVQVALESLDTGLDTVTTGLSDHLADGTDAHDASAISNVAAGNLAATDVQGALNELQSDIDTRALQSSLNTTNTNLSDHLADTVDAHDASAISTVPSGNLAATTVQSALNELQGDIDTTNTNISNHISDGIDAHDASAISTVPFGNFSSTNVQDGFNEIQTDIDNGNTNLANHIADATDAHTGSAISNTPSGNLAATTVQAALNELQSDVDTRALQSSLDTTNTNLANHLADTTDAHAGSAITNIPSGNLAATTVQAALNELQTDVDTRATSAALTAHEADTTAIHGIADTSLLVTTTGTQTLSNKTFSDSVTIAEVATPATPASGFGKVYFKTDGKLYQLNDAGIETEVGSGAGGGGTPDVDVILTQTFDDAVLGDFTQTGLSLATTNPLNGTVSALLTHQAGTSQSFAQTVSVPRKFRGVSNTIYTTLRSTATSGNVTLTITDVTNSATLQTVQLQTDSTSYSALTRTISSPTVSGFTNAEIGLLKVGMSVTGAGIPAATVINSINTTALTITLSQNATSSATGTAAMRISALPKTLQTGVTIPTNCSSISYTVTALLEANSPETYVDDIVIANYWMGSSNQGQSTVSFEVPSKYQAMTYAAVAQDATSEQRFTLGSIVSSGDSIIEAQDDAANTRTKFVALQQCQVDVTFSCFLTGTNSVTSIQKNGVQIATGAHVRASGDSSTTSVNVKLEQGDFLTFVGSPSTTSTIYLTLNARANQTKSFTTTDLVPAKAVLGNSTFNVPVMTEWTSYTPTFTGFGTPTSVEFQYRRNGQNAEIRGKFVGGTSTATEARVSLPNGYTSAGTSIIPSIQLAGKATYSIATATDPQPIIEPSVTYFTFGIQNASYAGLSKRNGDQVLVSGNSLSLFASVPIAGLTANSAVTVSGTQQLLKSENDSSIRLDTYNGYGSTATKIPRFTNLRQNIGSDIIYQDSSVNGASFTVATTGTYTFDFSIQSAASGATVAALSLNATGVDLSTNVQSLSLDKVLQQPFIAGITGATSSAQVSWTGYLNAGDVVRPHTNGSIPNSATFCNFTASKQGSVSVVNTTSDQKIEIPTSELRFEGASSRGSTATAIVKFDTMAKIRGDAFTVTNTAADGTFVTMTKAGRINLSGTITAASQNGLYLTKNQSTLTSVPTIASEILATTVSAGASLSGNIGYTGDVNVGDIIRFATTVTPAASTLNQFNISFQEQKIAVSVSNTLPQFSESDSSVRVDTANGYGSTATRVVRYSNIRDNIGTDIVYTDSATLGGSFVVQKSGIYDISLTMTHNAATGSPAITKNASSLTTDPASLAVSEILAMDNAGSGSSNNLSWQGYLNAGDIIRAQSNTAAFTGINLFTISKAGKPNVTGVNVTPFIELEYESTKYQEKASPITGTGIVSAMTFNNLTAGKTYRINMYVYFDGNNAGASNVFTRILNNGTAITDSELIFTHTTNDQRVSLFLSRIFVSNGGTLQVDCTSFVSPTSVNSRWQLEELPNHELTTQWT